MSPSEAQRSSPYQGLIPYSEQDAPFFFGREKETRLITANLFGSPLTLLYGASGVGKSSVLRAGVAHQLRERKDLLVLVFNAWQSNPVSDLRQAVADWADLADPAGWRKVVSLLPQDRVASLSEFLAICSSQLNRRLMIILDQFEEYFLYHPQDDEFAAEFSGAVTQSDAPVSFLISIREDFYAKLDRFEGRIPALYDNYLRIEHLDREAARAAIEGPIAKYNREYSTAGQQFSIEPELVEAVLTQVETGRVILGESGRGVIEAAKSDGETEAQIETPFLQLVMTRLWDEELSARSHKLRLETLNHLGGAENIVRTHLDAVITRLLPNEQEIAASVFHYLVTPSGTKIAYNASDLAGSAELNETDVVRVLEKLSHGDVRILRPVDPTPDRPTTPRYEIFHDVLAPAILTWRANYVQTKERAEAERQLALETEERARAEKQLARERTLVGRQRWLMVSLLLLLFVMLGLTAYAFQQRAVATSATAEAQRQQKGAEQERLGAVEQRNRAEEALIATKRAQEEADKQKNRAEQALVTIKSAQAQIEEKRNQAEQARAEAVKQGTRAQEAQATAEAAADAAETSAREAGRQRLMADEQRKIAQSRELAASAQAQLPFDLELSLLLASKAAEISPTAQAEETLRRTLLQSHERAVMRESAAPVRSAAFSPDGKYIVTGSDKSARVWDAHTGQSVAELPELAAPVKKIGFSPDSKFVVATAEGPTLGRWASGRKAGDFSTKTVQMWEVGRWRSLAIPQPADTPLMEEFSRDGHLVVVVSAHSNEYRGVTYWNNADTATVYETDQRQKIAELRGHKEPIRSAVFTPDGKYIVTSSRDGSARVWESRTGKSVAILQDKDEAIESAYLSPDGRYVVTNSSSGVKSWETSTGRKVSERPGQFNIIGSASSGDGKIIMIPQGETTALAWQVSSGHTITTKLGDSYFSSWQASFSPDGRFALLVSSYTTFVWNTSADQSGGVIELAGGGKASSVAFSPDSKLILTVNEDHHVRLWDAQTGSSVGIPLKHFDRVDSASFSPNSRFVVTASRDQIQRVWEANSGKLLAALRGHKDQVNDVAFSPDGRVIVTASDDKTARIWEVGIGGSRFEDQVTGVTAYAFSPDGQRVLMGDKDNSVQVGEVSTGRVTPKQRRPEGPVHSAALSPDGQRAVMATDDSAVRVWAAPTGQQVAELRAGTGHVQSLAFSPDSKYLLATRDSNTVRVWETSTGRGNLLELKNQTDPGRSVSFSADGKYIVAARGDRQVQIWEASTGNKLAVLSAQAQRESVNKVVTSPDGKFVITTNVYDALLWDLSTATSESKVVDQPSRVLHGDSVTARPVWNAAFSRDGKFAVVSGGYVAQVWQVNPARELFVLQGNKQDWMRSAEFSQDGQLIVTAGADKTACVWAAGTGQQLRQLSGHTGGVLNATFSPDGKFVVTASEDKTARIWEVSTGKTVAVMQGHVGMVTAATFSSDGKLVFTISGSVHNQFYLQSDNVADNTTRIWDAHTGQGVAVLPSSVAAISPDGKLVVTASQDDTAWVWETGTGRTTELRGHQGNVGTAAFSPDGELIATGSKQGTAWVWDAQTGRQLAVLRGHTGQVNSLAFSPDNKFVVTSSGAYKQGRAGDDDNTARVWEVGTGLNVAIMQGHTDWLNGATFSPDGRYVLTASRDKTARVWETSTGREMLNPKKHSGEVVVARFSHNGKYVVTASEDQTARVWNAGTGALISELLGHRGKVKSAAFSLDDKFVVTASSDTTARVWELSTGQSVGELLGHTNEVDNAVFSPDGKFVITSSHSPDYSAKVFVCQVCGTLEELKALARRRVRRDLTPDEAEKYLHLPQKRDTEEHPH